MKLQFLLRLSAISFLSSMMIVPIAFAEAPQRAKTKRVRSVKQPAGQGMFASLDLTEEQQSKIRAIQTTHSEKIRQQRENIKTAREELNQALSADTKERSVRRLFDHFNSEKRTMDKIHFEKQLAIRDVLSPEQRTKFRAYADPSGFRYQGPVNRRPANRVDKSRRLKAPKARRTHEARQGSSTEKRQRSEDN